MPSARMGESIQMKETKNVMVSRDLSPFPRDSSRGIRPPLRPPLARSELNAAI